MPIQLGKQRFSPLTRSVPLIGREAVLADLWNWMKNGRAISVRVMTARAGTGKTRLALELCDQAVEAGWEAGFLSEIPGGRGSWGWAGPTLAVVDYAASRVEPLRKWLIELADHPEQKGSPLRLLLLERYADPSGGWWRETFGVGGGDAEAVERLLDPASGPYMLPPLAGPDERRAVLGSILERVGSTVRLPEPMASPRFESRLAEISWGGEPLFLLMAGLVADRASFGEVLALSATDLGFRIAGHEIHRIHEIARSEEALELHRDLAASRPDAFRPELAMSLNNLSAGLSTLGSWEAALAASEESVCILGPYFLAHPATFKDWMKAMVGNYLQHARGADREPALELLAPIQSRLAELAPTSPP